MIELWDAYWSLLVAIWGDWMGTAGLRTALAILTPVLALFALALAAGLLRWIVERFRMAWLLASDEKRYNAEKQARDARRQEREQRTTEKIQRFKARQQRLSSQ